MNTVEALVARRDAVITSVYEPIDEYQSLRVMLRAASVVLYKRCNRGGAQFVVAHGQTLEAAECVLGMEKDLVGPTDVRAHPQFQDAKPVGVLPSLKCHVFASPKVPRGVFLLGRVSDGVVCRYESSTAPDGEPSVHLTFVPVERGSIQHFARVEVPALRVGSDSA